MKQKIYFILFFFLFPCCSSELSETDKIRNEIIKEFIDQSAKEGLYAAGIGGGEKDGKINLIDVCFDITCVMDINFGRKLLVERANALLKIVNSNEKYRDYFEHFPIDDRVLRLTIIGEKTINLSESFIQFVTLLDGRIYYKIDSDVIPRSTPLITVYKETFEEAKQILQKAGNLQ